VVVVHDWGGMSQDLRNQAGWLASEGYLAATPDLYYWGSRLRCLCTIMREIAAGQGRTFDDIDSARDWPARHDRCTGKIAVIGFCTGGAYAVALAPRPRLFGRLRQLRRLPEDLRHPLPRALRPGRTPPHRRLLRQAPQDLTKRKPFL
jgi:carboxymethylenebutenolidase